MGAYNPLLDQEFLKKLYSYRHREVFARVTALTFGEQPIENIEGRVTGGSINVDGTSNMRRTCSVTLVAKNVNINDYYWGLNQKFKLEIGLTVPDAIRNEKQWSGDINDYVQPYKKYPEIIWFNMGLYLFTNFSVSYSANNFTISVQGKDKMCLLNGSVSGSFFASITFDSEEYIDTKTGVTKINKIPIKYIIQEAVHEYAGEPFGNIIVNDLDDLGLELLRYNGVQPLYAFLSSNGYEGMEVRQIVPYGTFAVKTRQGTQFILDSMSEDANATYRLDTRTQRINIPEINSTTGPTVCYFVDDTNYTTPMTVAKFAYGQTVGYRTTDIIYAGDLVGNVGESLTSILDKIVTMLGEFEYFYDLDGHFIFQKKMNFIDHVYNPIFSSEQGSDDLYNESNTYIENAVFASSYFWTFDNNELVISFNNTPDILNVKNDFSLWGERESVSGAVLPVHMRYAIGHKPTFYTTYEGYTFLTKEEQQAIEDYNSSHNVVTITKSVHPVLSDEWWEVKEWAEYYGVCAALADGKTLAEVQELRNTEEGRQIFENKYYPKQVLGNYRRSTDAITLPTVGEIQTMTGWTPYYSNSTLSREQMIMVGGYCTGTSPIWDEDTETWSEGTYNTTLRPGSFSWHGSSCTHTYKWFMGLPSEITAYVYDPVIPSEELLRFYEQTQGLNMQIKLNTNKTVVCDWREIIYQMAKDYRRHNHDDDFYIKIRENNGYNTRGEWRYPKGITGYEPFYIDLEGFWRQLYCPSDFLYKSTDSNYKNVISPVLVKDDKLYFYHGDNKSYYDGPASSQYYRPLGVADLPKTAIVHQVKQYTFDPKAWAEAQIPMSQRTAAESKKDIYYTKENVDKYLIISNAYVYDEYGNIQTDTNGNPVLKLTYSETFCYGTYTKDGWSQDITTSPEALNFWFDMLDNGSSIANKYGIQTIGDRAKSVNDTSIKGIYFREVPTLIFTTDIQTQVRKSGYTYMQIPEEVNNLFVISSQGKSAQDALDEHLFKYSYCTERVSITTVPIYHLEPNTRIYIHDENSKVDGEYIVTRLSYPLTYSGTMSISAIKAVDRIY